jgi:hypothetical protein
MKKAYYYFLFRIFRFYKDKYKYDDWEALFLVVCISTTCIYFNLFSIYALANYFDLVPMFKNKYWVLPIMAIIAILNYYSFIRKKAFLECNFTKDKKGGWKVIIYFLITAAIAITIGYFNRQKIFAERKEKFPTEETVKQNSLESKLRDWWNNR